MSKPSVEQVPAFTIASNNYLGMALTFVESYASHHPEARIWVCVVDRPSAEIDYDSLPCEVIFAEDLGIEGFENLAFRYDILEFNTAVKPYVMRYLRDVVGLDRVFYFDPDILVMDRLSDLETALSTNLAVLTPHLTRPIDNSFRPPERVIRMCGTYNLGFVGLRLNEETRDFLNWWCDRLFSYCINDLPNGMFVDQSWMDFAPAYLESVAIVREPIFNIAYWNLPQRFPKEIDGDWFIDSRKIGFFHFSGLDLDDIDVISKHQDRIDLWSRPELRPLFEHYRDLIRASGQCELRAIEYAYHRFSKSEINIPRSARKIIQEIDPEGRRWRDPFETGGRDSFLAWLVRPVEVSGAMTSRAALGLWQARDDLRAAFPDPLGANSTDLARWFVDGGAAQSGFHPSLVDDLRRVRTAPVTRRSDSVARCDLADPGGLMQELNEPADGDESAMPLITHLAMKIYRQRPEVQKLYPDPLGADRREFAYWFVVFAREIEGLHPDLVRPVRESLPLKTRLAMTIKRVPVDGRSGRDRGHDLSKEEASPEPVTMIRSSGIDLSPPESFGVNLVGYFHGDRSASSFAPIVRDCMTEAGVPIAEIDRAHSLPGLMTTESIRHPQGAPFETSLLFLRSGEWKRAVDDLPVTTRAGGKFVGFVTEAAESLTDLALSAVHELWSPSPVVARRLEALTGRVVRVVKVHAPDWKPRMSEEIPRFDNGRIWLATSGEVCDDRLSVGASNVLEGLRRLRPEVQERVGVFLVSGAGSDHLEHELSHLPVKVIPRPARPDVLRSILDTCAGWINLDPDSELAPVHLMAETLGKPVIGLAPGGFTDAWHGAWTLSPASDVIGGAVGLLDDLARLDVSKVLKVGDGVSIGVDPTATMTSWRDAIRAVTAE